LSGIIEVGEVKAQKGSKAFGYLKVEETNGEKISLPVGILNGAKKGPILSLTGCTQGSTYTGPEACARIWKNTDLNKLSGAIIMVPVVNVQLFNARIVRQNPWDGKIIERECFPGNPEGTISFRIADKLFKEVILKSSHHIDFRGGDLDECETHFILYTKIGTEKIDKELDAIAKICGMKYIYQVPWNDSRKSNLSGAALEKGVISVVLMGARGVGELPESDVTVNLEFVNNVMMYLKMIPGTVKPLPQQFIFDKAGRITAKLGGIWQPTIGWGETFKKGQVTGYVKDLKGDILQEVVSPVDGIVHVLKPYRVVRPGETLYSYQTLKEAWK
jgi:uncharacterized protein